MYFIVYNIFLYVYFTISFPFYLIKFFTSEKYRTGLRERLGFLRGTKGRKTILVHTVSVGEFLGSLSFIEELKKTYPECEVVVSTTTVTANRIAKKKIGSGTQVVFFPLDFSWAVKRFLDRVSPYLVIIVETELWPNFLWYSEKRKIQVLVVNGRISGHSFRDYLHIKKFFKDVCKNIKLWGVQFERDKNRLIELGIDKEKIRITGSMKFDSAVQQAKDIGDTYSEWGLTEGVKVLVGGSIHNGEEKILLDIYRRIKDNFKNLVLILVPRHTERAKEIKKLVDAYNLRCMIRSEWEKTAMLSDCEVVLVDTFGELMSVYNLADVVFIGKSMVKGGGQNLLEPAALGKPVICGPLMSNFLDITEWLVQNNGVIQVKDIDELEKTILDLLKNPERCEELGNRAKELVYSATGTTGRNLELLL